jgi:hypothetical protein
MTVPKRFGVLRFVAALLKVIAWIVLILAILGAVVAGLSNFTTVLQTPSVVSIPILGQVLNLLGAGASGILAAVVAALSGVLLFILYFALAESISMQLAVEENTRLTAALLLRMHQESQPDTRSAYTSSGYPSEPFEG